MLELLNLDAGNNTAEKNRIGKVIVNTLMITGSVILCAAALVGFVGPTFYWIGVTGIVFTVSILTGKAVGTLKVPNAEAWGVVAGILAASFLFFIGSLVSGSLPG